MTISDRQSAYLGCISFSLSVDKMFRTQNHVYSSNIDVVLRVLTPECVKLLIYADVIRGHVIIHSGLIANLPCMGFR